MTKFLYFTSVVTYRIPIKEDGTPGNPEILKKFTEPTKGTQKLVKKRAAPKQLQATEQEVLEL